MNLRKLPPSPRPSRNIERRTTSRLEGPFPAIIRGVNRQGVAFEEQIVVDDLSAKGLYVRMRERLERGNNVFIVVSLLDSCCGLRPQLRVAVRGRVVRVEPQPGGGYGAGIALAHYRLL